MKNKKRLQMLPKAFFSILILFVFITFAAGQLSTEPKLRPIQQDGKWGYIDQTGKVVIKPQFYWAEEFSDGMATFQNDEGLCGYIDEIGKVVIEPTLEQCSPFSEGLAAAEPSILNWGYLDKAGKWVIEPQFSYARPFRDGFAAVEIRVEKDGVILMAEKKSTMIDKTGKPVIEPVPYVLNNGTSKGVAFLQYVSKSPAGDGSTSLLIDHTGKVILECENIDELAGFSEEVTPVKKGGKWGYVDTSGKFVIEPRFDSARSFSEGRAAVQIGDNWGYIDHSGKLLIPAKFSINDLGDYGNSYRFSEGLALVYFGDDLVYINANGSIVLKPRATDAGSFIGGLAAVRITHKSEKEERGYINRQGQFVWGPMPFKYLTNDDIRAQIKKREEKEGTGEKLSPLSDDEKKLNYRDIVANQPDFTAEMSYFRSHYVSGSGFAYKLTRSGNRFRKESQFWIFVGETGKSRVRLNPDKTYSEEGVDNEVPGSGSDFNPKLLAAELESVFTPLGKITIDGHECIKISVKRKDAAARHEELYLYTATDLKNLIIVARLLDSNNTLVQRLGNISLDVPHALVQIPPGYSKATGRR